MVKIREIEISPPLVNTSCAWASDLEQLTGLFDCPHTGAVSTRTATLEGFKEDSSHAVAFLKDSLSSLNSYGYSPHPLDAYIGPKGWVRELLERSPGSTKPFIISITDSTPDILRTMLRAIQNLRASNPSWRSRIAVEFNASCPNIKGHPPPSYNFSSLVPLLDVFRDYFLDDQTLTIGIKLPPYVAATQFMDVTNGIASYTDSASGKPTNPFAFFTCTNTLGNSLVFSDQAVTGDGGAVTGEFAVPPGVGGLAGEAIHSLSLGNVYTFSRLLAGSGDPAMREIVIVGAGGVTSPEAVARMRRAGAKVVGCATLLGKRGVAAFEHLSGKSSTAL
ncbi:hypothetical protein HYDPIDRAFT_81307 [Hydnomerulius pinastri MD-312]|nr:hypothetical protein HYDPIDRAFT_81307 [Hydnomerulius pinastri MD-312]